MFIYWLKSLFSLARKLFRRAIPECPAALVLAHNHPIGEPSSFAAERCIAQTLVTAGRLIDIPIHDYIIIEGDRYTSFLEERWLWVNGRPPATQITWWGAPEHAASVNAYPANKFCSCHTPGTSVRV